MFYCKYLTQRWGYYNIHPLQWMDRSVCIRALQATDDVLNIWKDPHTWPYRVDLPQEFSAAMTPTIASVLFQCAGRLPQEHNPWSKCHIHFTPSWELIKNMSQLSRRFLQIKQTFLSWLPLAMKQISPTSGGKCIYLWHVNQHQAKYSLLQNESPSRVITRWWRSRGPNMKCRRRRCCVGPVTLTAVEWLNLCVHGELVYLSLIHAFVRASIGYDVRQLGEVVELIWTGGSDRLHIVFAWAILKHSDSVWIDITHLWNRCHYCAAESAPG